MTYSEINISLKIDLINQAKISSHLCLKDGRIVVTTNKSLLIGCREMPS